MSFLLYWFKSKKPSESDPNNGKAQSPSGSASTLESAKPFSEETKIHSNHGFANYLEKSVYSSSPMKKNSLWDLLSDFTIFTESPAVLQAKTVINDGPVLPAINSITNSTPVNGENVMTQYSEFAKSETSVPTEKPLLTLLLDGIRFHQEQMSHLYTLHTALESNIASLLNTTHTSTFSLKTRTLVAEFMKEAEKALGNLANFIKELNELVTLSLEAKAKVSQKQSRTKYSALGASALGLAVGVAFPYVAVGGIAVSMISGGALFRKNKDELDVLVTHEELLVGLLTILLEKKDKFETSMDYFKEVRKHVESLCEDPKNEEVITKVKQLVPLKVLNILLQKKKML